MHKIIVIHRLYVILIILHHIHNYKQKSMVLKKEEKRKPRPSESCLVCQGEKVAKLDYHHGTLVLRDCSDQFNFIYTYRSRELKVPGTFNGLQFNADCRGFPLYIKQSLAPVTLSENTLLFISIPSVFVPLDQRSGTNVSPVKLRMCKNLKKIENITVMLTT